MSDSEDSFESADEGDSQVKKESRKKQVSQSSVEELESPKSETLAMEDIDKSEPSDNSEVLTEKTVSDTTDTVEENDSSDSKPAQVKTETVKPKDAMKLKEDGDQEEVETKKEENITEKPAEEISTTTSQSTDSGTLEGQSKEKETDKKKENPDTTNPKQPLDKLAESEGKPGWGWGSWGTSILQTASESVNTFTSSVGEGFSTVMETVESSLGAPDPSELASQQKVETEEAAEGQGEAENKEVKGQASEAVDPEKGPNSQDMSREAGSEEAETRGDEVKPSEASPTQDGDEEEGAQAGGWFSGFGVSSITGVVKQTVQQTSSLVQEKSKGLVHGSLDVLETLGKKTFDVLAEGDHGLKKTIEKAKAKPNLSVLLREAADEAAETAKLEEEFVESQKSHFGAQFDEFQGLVQLEALEMLSNQCEARLHSLLTAMSADEVATVKQELVSIKGAFELGDMDDDDDEDTDHNFPDLVTEFTGKLGLNLTAEKLIEVHQKVRERIASCTAESTESDHQSNVKLTHQIAIQSLAEVTAKTVGHFHRIGQLMLMDPKGPVSAYKDKAGAITSLTKCVCCEVSILSSKCTQSLTSAADKSSDTEDVNPLITSVYLEATNSSTYLHDAMQLLLPVVQQAAVECT